MSTSERWRVSPSINGRTYVRRVGAVDGELAICHVMTGGRTWTEYTANALLLAHAPSMQALLADAALQLERLTGESLETYARTFAALAKQELALIAAPNP